MCWIVTWDDHEFDNNYAGAISEEPDVDVEKFLARRAAAYQAYYEHMPLRRSTLPHGPMMQLYRNVTYGRLVQFSVLDTRQHRTDQPCGDRNKPPCDGVFDPNATLLGKIQEKWLCDGLAASPARWNVLAQQVMMADNPFVKFYNAERGYVRCTVTPKQWQSDFRVVPIVSKPKSPCLTRASFVVEDGQPGAERV